MKKNKKVWISKKLRGKGCMGEPLSPKIAPLGTAYTMYLYMCASCVDVLLQKSYVLLDGELAAVDTQIVVSGIAPFAVAVAVVVILTLFVLLFHQLFGFVLRQMIDAHNAR